GSVHKLTVTLFDIIRSSNVTNSARTQSFVELSGACERARARDQGVTRRKCANTKRKPNIGGCYGFFRRTPEEVGKQQRFAYIHEHAEKAELALYCRVLCVTVQGYKKHVQSFSKPYKYAALLASIKAISAEDIFNKNYGKRRIYEKLQLDYDCAYSYNTVAKVLREHGLLHKVIMSNKVTVSLCTEP
ncbi:MAG: transposase, partial [Clostridia bacterium]